jgi:hypothetical protein
MQKKKKLHFAILVHNPFLHFDVFMTVQSPTHLLLFCCRLAPVERPGPKGLSTLVSALRFRHIGDLNSCPADLKLGALT